MTAAEPLRANLTRTIDQYRGDVAAVEPGP